MLLSWLCPHDTRGFHSYQLKRSLSVARSYPPIALPDPERFLRKESGEDSFPLAMFTL
jgi:hypothetical protein